MNESMRVFTDSTSTNTPRIMVFDHVSGEMGWLDELLAKHERIPDPPGPLNRAQHALWKRPRGRVLGNLLSDLRYWLWRLDR